MLTKDPFSNIATPAGEKARTIMVDSDRRSHQMEDFVLPVNVIEAVPIIEQGQLHSSSGLKKVGSCIYHKQKQDRNLNNGITDVESTPSTGLDI